MQKSFLNEAVRRCGRTRQTLNLIIRWADGQALELKLEITMTQRTLMAVAAVSLLSTLMVAAPAAAQEKEKCFGIVKAGQNDCANLSGSHSCAGQSKLDMDKGEWKYVAKGTCKGMKGMTADEAKMAK
jgi:uncharacterized membrane protein